MSDEERAERHMLEALVCPVTQGRLTYDAAAQEEIVRLYLAAAILFIFTAAAVLGCSLVGIYLVYFRAANAAFLQRAVPAAELAGVLARWAAWHRARVIVCVAAFGLSLVALVA